jgi:hypothetical protein
MLGFQATKSGGNISSQSFSLIFGPSAGIQAWVSNRSPHFVQVQRLTTKFSLTNSDQSGETNVSQHFGQVVIMAASLAYSYSPFREWGVL